MKPVFIIIILCTLLTASPLKKPAKPVKVPILMYHHIRTLKDTDDKMLKDTSCSPTLFINQLQYLKAENYTTITFIDLQNYIFGLDTLPPKPVILSFDDGYDDNLWAAKKLHEQNLKGVFFVVTKTLDTPEHLTTANLRLMSSWGMEIGSHGKYHADLRQIRFDKVPLQMAESKKVLEAILGVPVISFCYPAGGYTYRIGRACSKTGFWFARTTRPGISYIHGKHFALRTLRIDDNTDIPNLKKLLKK